eukprot:2623298-Pleurochrysis_carterae.AAC.1
MRSVAEMAAPLASPDAPTDLVACEFSGAVRDALTAAGRTAVSCYLRDSESRGGYHYHGELRNIAHMRRWVG